MAPAHLWGLLRLAAEVVAIFLESAIGGLFGGLATGISSRIFRSDRSEGLKYALTGVISLGAFVAYFVTANSIVTAIRK